MRALGATAAPGRQLNKVRWVVATDSQWLKNRVRASYPEKIMMLVRRPLPKLIDYQSMILLIRGVFLNLTHL